MDIQKACPTKGRVQELTTSNPTKSNQVHNNKKIPSNRIPQRRIKPHYLPNFIIRTLDLRLPKFSTPSTKSLKSICEDYNTNHNSL